MESRIARVETFVVRYATAGHFKFFRGLADRRCVLVKVTDESGNVGWGQAVPSPGWSYETVETVRTTIDHYLGPAIVGQDAFDEGSIDNLLQRTIAPSFSTGQPICKAGLNLALFDLTGRMLGQTAAARWGRASVSHIRLSWTINPASLDDLASNVQMAHERGFVDFNVKVGMDATFDVAICRELRRMAPNAFFWVDANGGYDVETAIHVAPKFADLGVAAFEQPVAANRLSQLRRLRQQGALPILLDEAVVSLVDLMEFHQLNLLDGVAMKVARCGGLDEARRMIEYLESEELLLFASGLTDPDLALAASLHLFAAYGLARPAALNAPQYLAGSFLKQPIVVQRNHAQVPNSPGLGVDIDELRVAEASR